MNTLESSTPPRSVRDYVLYSILHWKSNAICNCHYVVRTKCIHARSPQKGIPSSIAQSQARRRKIGPVSMEPPRWLLSILFRPVRLLVVSVVLAFASMQLAMHTQRHNPNSHFFDPDVKTFASPYTDARKAQARAWTELMDSNLQQKDTSVPLYKSAPQGVPDLSVVFVSVRRPNEQYLDVSVGSFLMELPAEQRKRMHLAISFGEEESAQQPFFSSAWVHGLVDEVAVRKRPSGPYLPPSLAERKTQPTAQLTVLPRPLVSLANKDLQTSEWHRRGTVDYSLALELCSRQKAPYCLIVEDDTVFATRWYDRFAPSLRTAEEWTQKRRKPWAYMRLFYAEKYFGWENEEVQKLVIFCAGIVGTVALALLLFGRMPARYAALAGVRSRVDLLHSHRDDVLDSDERKPGGGRIARIRLPLGSQLIIVLLTLYYCILFILIGRNYVYRVPHGVSEMNERGCCTQAIVYPADVVQPLIDHLRDRLGVRPYDILINRWVALNDRVKLAVHPPLVQHIGVGSTQAMIDETYSRSTPLWSFAFEKLAPKLRS